MLKFANNNTFTCKMEDQKLQSSTIQGQDNLENRQHQPTMNITELADENLSLILNSHHLPLHRLLELRSVGTKFNDVISSMLRSRRSLKLFGSVYSFLWQHSALVRLQQEEITGGQNIDTDIMSNVISWKGLKLSDAEEVLPKLFPNLETFFFCNIDKNQFPLHKLLLQWPNKLRTVIIWGDPSSPEDWVDMWVSMHSQHNSLRHLGLMNFTNIDVPEDCQIMKNISQLSVKGYHSKQLQYLLLRLGPNCDTLNLESSRFDEPMLNVLVTAGKCHFITSLTLIDLDNYTKNKANRTLTVICDNFVNLHYFHPRFACEHLQIDEIQAEIRKLPQLKTLRLCLSSDIFQVGVPSNYSWLSPNRSKRIFPLHPPYTELNHLILENYRFQKLSKSDDTQLNLFEVLAALFPKLDCLKIWSPVANLMSDEFLKKVKALAAKNLTMLKKFTLQTGEPLESVKTGRWHPTLEYSSGEEEEEDEDE